MWIKTFKTYSYHREVSSLGTPGALSVTGDRRKKRLAKRLFTRKVPGLLLACCCSVVVFVFFFSTVKFKRRKFISNIIMAQSIARVPILPVAFFGSFLSCRSRWWGFVTKPLPGGGAFVNSSRRGYRRSFFNISLKIYRKIPKIGPSKYKPPKPVTHKTLR